MHESPEISPEASPRGGNAGMLLKVKARVSTSPLLKSRTGANAGITLGGITLASGAALAIASATLNLGLALIIVGGVIAALGLLAILIAGIYKASINKSVNYAEDSDNSTDNSPIFSKK